MFYKREREYQSEKGKSIYLHRVIPEKVTIPKVINPHIFKQLLFGDHRTVFKEVSVVPYWEGRKDWIEAFQPRKIPQEIVSTKEFAEKVFETMKRVIYESWKPNKFHLIPHSSGWDTRVISKAIKELHKEHGDEWLGEIKFFEAHGERDETIELMKLEGWSEDDFIGYSDVSEPLEFHAPSFDFKTAWKRNNGVCGFPVNVWYTPLEWFQKKGLVPKSDVQLITGYGANETTQAVWNEGWSLEWYYWWIYYHALSIFPIRGEMIHPFYHIDMATTLHKYGLNQLSDFDGLNGNTFSRIVQEQLFPELNQVKKLTRPEVTKKGFFDLSDRIIKQSIEDYKGSWLGKNFDKKLYAINMVDYDEWWGMWSFASFCEHLISKGHKIEVEK